VTDAVLPLALFVLGLASGAHCLGMCGGIVTAFASPRVLVRKEDLWKRQFAFNGGRLTSYALAGFAAGAFGSAGAWVAGALPLQTALYVLANVLLVCIGLHLAGLWTPLRWMENTGTPLWRLVQPLAARFAAGGNAWLAGMAWGWLPCGLVYSALAAAVFAGSPLRGTLAMLAFGLGTLPWLLAAGMLAQRLRLWTSRPAIRITAGSVVATFGAAGLAHAGSIQSLLCR
jgi:uncharacterized protein